MPRSQVVSSVPATELRVKDGRPLAIQRRLVIFSESFGREDHDRNRARRFLGAKRLHDVETAQAGHDQVEQDQVGQLRFAKVDAFLACARPEHSKARGFQESFQ